MRYLFLALLIPLSNFSNAQLQFSETATSTGANYNYGYSTIGGGVSFVDFDSDGWDDLTYSTDETQEICFLKNNAGTFTRIIFQGIDEEAQAKQVLWVDYDNDGDKDFFVTNVQGRNSLYQNDGNFVFTDVTVTVGLYTNDLPSYGAAFGDIDNDGDLDLFLSTRGTNTDDRNYLYRNDNGSFVDITQTAGISLATEFSFCASFFDYDNDGDQDLYISNDKISTINRLYQNNGDETFVDVSVASGTGITANAMSTTIGDYNTDGFFDIYVSNTSEGNYLLKNNGDGTFTNKASETGTEFFSLAWGSVFLDADNDSNLDLYVSGALDGSVSSLLSSAFYHNDGNQNYSIPNDIGFLGDTGMSYSNAIGDIDNNGKPDIVVMNHLSDYYLWKNLTTNSNNWIKIKLEGITSNKDGIGNRIEIHANGESQYRYTLCGEGYLGQNSNYEFVGLSDAINIDYIKVTWNKTGITETINNVSPNQAITIQEGNGILDTTSNELIHLNVYPNPSNEGVFNFSVTNNISCTIAIFDLSGRLIFEKGDIENADLIDLSQYDKGIYLAKISSGTKSSLIKLIVD